MPAHISPMFDQFGAIPGPRLNQRAHGNAAGGRHPSLARAEWAAVLVDASGGVVVMGAVAGAQSAPRVELTAAHYVADVSAGIVRLVTDGECTCGLERGGVVAPTQPGG